MTPGSLSELPAALARLECSGERHTIRWEAGNLAALDHADPEGERALVALGGTSSTCVDVLGAWSRQKENPSLLSALSRGTHDPVRTDGLNPGHVPHPASMTPPRNMVMPGRSARGTGTWITAVGNATPAIALPGAGAASSRGGAIPTLEEDIVLLAGLGHELTLRLVATVTAVLLDRLSGPDGQLARPALEASLFGRALSALRSWLAAPGLEVDLMVAGPGDVPSVEWDGGGPIHLALPLDWVVRVWGRDMTVVAGRFSLGIVDSNPRRTSLTTVGSDLGSPQRLVIELA